MQDFSAHRLPSNTAQRIQDPAGRARPGRCEPGPLRGTDCTCKRTCAGRSGNRRDGPEPAAGQPALRYRRGCPHPAGEIIQPRHSYESPQLLRGFFLCYLPCDRIWDGGEACEDDNVPNPHIQTNKRISSLKEIFHQYLYNDKNHQNF